VRLPFPLLLRSKAAVLTGLLGLAIASPASIAADLLGGSGNSPSQVEGPSLPNPPSVATSSTGAPRVSSPWAGTVELYGLAPLRTSGTATIRGLSTDFDLDLGQVLQPLSAFASLRGSVEYGRLGLLSDLSYLSLQGAQGLSRGGLNADQSFGPLGRKSASLAIGSTTINGSMGLVQGVYDLALRYRFGERESAVARPGSFTVIPYAGIRLVNLQVDLGLEGQGAGSSITVTGPNNSFTLNRPAGSFTRYGELNSTVAQPLLGTQAMLFLSPRLRLFARGDIGGFGIDQPENLSWNAQAGLGYAIGNSTQLNLSWRMLHLGGSNGAPQQNAFDVNENGIEMGVKFFF